MLNKLSKVQPVSKIGVLKIKIFEVYSKKKFSNLKFFGVVKGSVSQTNRFKKFLSGYKIKSYVTQTKQTRFRTDGSNLLFFKNKTCIKHRKLKRFKKNFGPVQKNIKNKKFMYRFIKII